ncbi:hypothetical protein V8C34DRAFT_322905 [Trichoderma compactum]
MEQFSAGQNAYFSTNCYKIRLAMASLEHSSSTLRAVTRNCQSQSAKGLAAKGVGIVQATTNDVSSLTAAFQGSSIILGVTGFFGLFGGGGPLKTMGIKSSQALNLAIAAAATPTLEHYIWSTLPDANPQSSGKFLVPHFESKNTTFVIMGYYAANFYWQTQTPIIIPSAGKYAQLNGYPAATPLRPISDAENNVGIFIKAIIDQHNKTLPGKHMLVHTENITCGEMLHLWAEAQGKAAEYIELQPEEFNKIWPGWVKETGVMMQFFWWAKTTRSQNEGVLTRDDLGISGGLIETKEAFFAVGFSNGSQY